VNSFFYQSFHLQSKNDIPEAHQNISTTYYGTPFNNLIKTPSIIVFNAPGSIHNARRVQVVKSTKHTVTSKDSKNALAFYLAAVTAGRLQDETGGVSNIKKAVSINDKLVNNALADLEFEAYWNSDNFKNALK
jgi:hypothetical protein